MERACARLVGRLALRRRLGLGVWQASSGVQPGSSAGPWRGTVAAGGGGWRDVSGSAQHIVSSPVPDIPLPSGNAAAYVLENWKQWSNKTALECAVSGRSYTYAQVVDAAARWGGCLTALGLRKGDTLAVMMLNCPEYPLVVLGAIAVGVPVTVINSAYTSEEVCRHLRDSDASLVVHDDATEKVVEAAISLLQKPLRRITNTDASPPAGVPSLRSLLQDSSLPLADPVEVIGTETALIPYSSGTTGNPKGVDVPHKALTSNVAIFSHPSFYSAKASTGTHAARTL
ncbi:4-coumarate--CoA ligase 3 [Chionoecetes opilio]|uniref:4-coumarate--CoA ligase 3 n=1 Tax=Chionoecetes opilio TaxID=41210 RepID=A0A8J5D178_CHIOP|nr:4-coumarate--CoA ligase 3 [Chionoecetes opilio]